MSLFYIKIRLMHYLRSHHFIHTVTLLQVSALKRPFDAFCEQGQQNTCPGVNISEVKIYLHVSYTDYIIKI
jgi:hypothetical protein